MIKLEPFTPYEFQNLIDWIESEKALEMWGRWRFTYPLDKKQLNDYLANVGDGSPFFIFKAEHEDKTIGHVELSHINFHHQVGTICRVLVNPNLRNQGYGGKIVLEALRYGFRSLALRRIDLQVYHNNHIALKCYQKLGFVHEGRLRQLKKVGNEYWDLIWMSMLSDEYAKLNLPQS